MPTTTFERQQGSIIVNVSLEWKLRGRSWLHWLAAVTSCTTVPFLALTYAAQLL